jgi:acyl-CoA reductase-like NAD-dependent aldehyde dehydrogenase
MDYRMLIAGKLVSSDTMADVVNPATEEVFARVPQASDAQLDEAVAAAAAAQKNGKRRRWPSVAPRSRRWLRQLESANLNSPG